MGPDPFIGYSPHSLRYLAKQFVDSPAALKVLSELGVDPKKQDVIGEVLLDHKVAGMPALYKGEAGKVRQEYFSFVATQITYRMLVTDLGARRVPDGDDYRRTLIAHELLSDQIAALQSELRSMVEGAQRSGAEVLPTSALSRALSLDELREQHKAAEEAIKAIENGERTIPLPDGLSDEEVPVVDLSAIKAAALQSGPEEEGRRPRRVRNWLTPEEFAKLAGCSSASVRNWVASGTPGRSGAWDPADPPIASFNSKRRAIRVSGLNAKVLFDTFEKREALEDTLAKDPPAGWTGLPRWLR